MTSKMNSSTSLVSVIVPVYNGEKYIEDCIGSLINQTYHNIEIIIVNDGSTDGTMQKCEKYKREDSRIHIYDRRNHGVSAARNYGIKAAKGRYISFVDADDYVGNDFIENLVKVIPLHGIAICGYKRLEDDRITAEYKIEGSIDSKLLYKSIFTQNIIACGCWNKLFSSDVIKNNKLHFNEKLYIGEDMVFLAEYLNDMPDGFVYIPKASYVYRRNSQSAMQSGYYENKFDTRKYTCLDAVDKLKNLCQKAQEEYIKECFSYRIVRSCLWLLFQMICSKNYEKKILKEIKKRIRNNIRGYLHYNEGIKLECAAALFVCISPTLVYLAGQIAFGYGAGLFDKYLN